jgi:hypothetical protein
MHSLKPVGPLPHSAVEIQKELWSTWQAIVHVMHVNPPSVLENTEQRTVSLLHVHRCIWIALSPNTGLLGIWTLYATSACSDVFHMTDDGCMFFYLYQFSRAAELGYSSRLCPLLSGVSPSQIQCIFRLHPVYKSDRGQNIGTRDIDLWVSLVFRTSLADIPVRLQLLLIWHATSIFLVASYCRLLIRGQKDAKEFLDHQSSRNLRPSWCFMNISCSIPNGKVLADLVLISKYSTNFLIN